MTENAKEALSADAGEPLFDEELASLRRATLRVFRWLLLGQWGAAVLCALWLSPLTWSGSEAALHWHLPAAVLLGGLLAGFPIALIGLAPSWWLTRHATTIAQMLFSALFIHLMGGRIEAHFHVFGSLAVLAFYRDPWVFVSAVTVTLVDHVGRGLFWPESVFGVATPTAWRALEHTGWVVFESAFLIWGIRQSRDHLRRLADALHETTGERDSLRQRATDTNRQLGESRGFFENVVDSLSTQLCILDDRGCITATNAAWREFHSAIDGGAEDLCRPGVDYLSACSADEGPHQASARALADSIEAVIACDRDRAIGQLAYGSPDGDRWFQYRVTPFVGGDHASVVVSLIDITERVHATKEANAKTSHAAALAKIITESPNEVYICRQIDLRFVVVNDGAVGATGYSREELLRMTPLDLNPEFDAVSLREALAPLTCGKASVLDFATTHRRRDGLTYPVQVSLSAATYGGAPVFVAFVTDISEIRQLESRLSQAQKLESIGQLAAGIAHEINTPMQCVSNNVEFLSECHSKLFDVVKSLRELFESHATPWQERRDRVHALIAENRFDLISAQAPQASADAAEASHRVIEIVRAMRAMSHPGSRQKSVTDINEILENAAVVSKNRWKYCAELDLQLDDSIPAIPVLPAELNQVFLNLIVNAADAIAENNEGSDGLGRITVRTYRENGQLGIDVEDTGGGVPEEIRSRIYDPFFTTKEVGKGTGQGLAIAYDVIANKHGGTIDLRSTDGVGRDLCGQAPGRGGRGRDGRRRHAVAGRQPVGPRAAVRQRAAQRRPLRGLCVTPRDDADQLSSSSFLVFFFFFICSFRTRTFGRP